MLLNEQSLPYNSDALSIVQITDWPEAEIAPLVTESELDGFRFLNRLRAEWLSGANRFSKDGEALFGVYQGIRLVAVGGLNRQASDCGRLRHFYVAKGARRAGIGRRLGLHILNFAAQHYAAVLLRTDTAVARQFYASLGFVPVARNDHSTHELKLVGETSQPER